MRLKYVLNEVLIGLWRNITMTIAMMITLSVSLTMLGASALMYLQVGQMKDFYYAKIEVSIFLTEDITDGQRAGIDAALTASPLVRDKVYETKAQALARFRKMFRDSPTLVDAVRPDTLPESFRVKLKDPEAYDEFTRQLAGRPGIQLIVDQREVLGKVFRVFSSIQLLALVIASVMAVAGLLLVGNIIQVAAYSKRREVAVMKLVGASNWFIQAPFVLEAMAAGLAGSLLAFGGLYAGKVLLLDGPLQALSKLMTPIPDGNLWLMLPLLAAAGAGTSGVAGWITLRFHIRV
ncbi:permease-like cell division protein FtsX [Actinoplanes sp. NPDC051470]|uniref:permease-like cell division protein FtsX n=1 Tax=Actinoplanes sp. NPDC051470 TaxID=3157224 RepID=UPI00343AA490